MWRYLSNVSQPEKKRKLDDSYQKEYEKKRDRQFQPSWTIDRPWLEERDGRLFCTYCCKFGGTGNFVSGCESYKIDTINKHAKSKQHQHSESVAVAKKQPVENSSAAGIVRLMNKDIIDKLSVMFRTVHALSKHNRPLSDFVWMSNLDEMKSNTSLGTTYRNKVSATNFRSSIAALEFQRVTERMETMKFMCLIGDGSTDVSVQEQELWYVRAAHHGTVHVFFIGVSSPDQANAVGIVSCINTVLQDNHSLQWVDVMAKTVALSCDGASVMVGCRNGVSAIMKKEQESLITIHCMAHRLELALKDSLKSVKLFDKCANQLLMGIYLFYHNSALNRAMLKRAY